MSMPTVEDDMEWNEEKVEQLKALWAAGRSQPDIAAEMGTTTSTIAGKVRRLNLPTRTKEERSAAISSGVRAHVNAQRLVQEVSLAHPLPKPTPAHTPPALPADLFDMLANMPNEGATAVLSLRWRDCKWPIGDLIRAPDGFRFCRAPRLMVPGRGRDGERMLPYCGEHCRIAYGPGK